VRLIPIIFCFSLVQASVFAQETLSILDEETQEPVEGVFVKLISNLDGSTDFFVSNKQGKLNIPQGSIQFPAILWASHLNYAPYTDSLYTPSSSSLNIHLTPAFQQLEEVVVTGQYEPQSAEHSVYKIKTINQYQIEARGATNLQDVLTTSMNVRLNNDPATGSTSLSMQGVSGENIKVLIDGVPVTGKVANQTDLNQIDINEVEKIEIIEGPMAVNYGSNALGGVINILTKKNSSSKWFTNITLNEETVADEYGADKGIHNQHISGGYNISDASYGQISFTHNYFGGYSGSSESRSTNWDPKTQYLGSVLFRLTPGNLKSFYKLDVLNELIENKGEVTGIFEPIALDEEYRTNRYIHQIQLSSKISKTSNFNSIFSYTDYKRTKTQFITNFATGEKPLSTAEGSQDTTYLKAFNFRGTNRYFPSNSNVSMETGYDINLESGQGGRILGDANKSINDYALFGSMEIIANGWKFRPALRAAYNTKYNTPLVPSLHMKKNFGKSHYSFKMGYGRGFRAPSLKELYLEFIDSNHRILGNENLEPEDSHHLDAGITYKRGSIKAGEYKFDFSLFYNDITNKIGYGQSPDDPTVTTYINVDQFKSIGTNLLLSYHREAVSGEAGFGYTGTSSSFDPSTDDEYLFSPEVILNLSFKISSSINAGLYYKYTGEVPFYVLEDGETVIERREGYSWMDVTGGWQFSKAGKLTLGIKNLLNVTDISNSVGSATHSGGLTTPVSYGRSAFLRIDFKIKG
jgi:outer membrane receptor for ferrienterochelin and colicins